MNPELHWDPNSHGSPAASRSFGLRGAEPRDTQSRLPARRPGSVTHVAQHMESSHPAPCSRCPGSRIPGRRPSHCTGPPPGKRGDPAPALATSPGKPCPPSAPQPPRNPGAGQWLLPGHREAPVHHEGSLPWPDTQGSWLEGQWGAGPSLHQRGVGTADSQPRLPREGSLRPPGSSQHRLPGRGADWGSQGPTAPLQGSQRRWTHPPPPPPIAQVDDRMPMVFPAPASSPKTRGSHSPPAVQSEAGPSAHTPRSLGLLGLGGGGPGPHSRDPGCSRPNPHRGTSAPSASQRGSPDPLPPTPLPSDTPGSLRVPWKPPLTCQPPAVPRPPGQAPSRERGEQVQPHGQGRREVPPRGRPPQHPACRLGVPRPRAMQRGGSGHRWSLGCRWPGRAGLCEQLGAARSEWCRRCLRPSSLFPGPARPTTLTQTPVTTAGSPGPRPRASWKRTLAAFPHPTGPALAAGGGSRARGPDAGRPRLKAGSTTSHLPGYKWTRRPGQVWGRPVPVSIRQTQPWPGQWPHHGRHLLPTASPGEHLGPGRGSCRGRDPESPGLQDGWMWEGRGGSPRQICLRGLQEGDGPRSPPVLPAAQGDHSSRHRVPFVAHRLQGSGAQHAAFRPTSGSPPP